MSGAGESKLRFAATLVLLLFPVNLFAAKVSRMQYAMGTTLLIVVEAENAVKASEALETAFETVRKFDDLLSNYKSDSELSRMNRQAAARPVSVSAEMFGFLDWSLQYGEKTEGFFDVTMEPLTELWGLRKRELPSFPTEEQIEIARKRVNYKKIELLPDRQVHFRENGMGIDSGGIGKGYGLDRALEKLKQEEMDSVTFNFGGEILEWSREPRSSGFSVRSPLNSSRIWSKFQTTASSGAKAISTSGNYERFVTYSAGPGIQGRVGHLLNPKTGKPGAEIESVTVFAATATEADVFSTAIFVMGLEQGKIYSDQEEIAALILYKSKDGTLESVRSQKWSKCVSAVKE